MATLDGAQKSRRNRAECACMEKSSEVLFGSEMLDGSIGQIVRDGVVARSGAGTGAFGANGIFQRPLVELRLPTMMTCPSLIILTSYLDNRATQSSSQSCPMEMKDPDLRLSKTCPDCALLESSCARGMRARFMVVRTLSPFATCTEGPVSVCPASVQQGSAAGLRWWPVAPVSTIAMGAGGVVG